MPAEKLITQEELADLAGVAVGTVENWRYKQDEGPDYVKVGRLVRYRPSAVEKWLAANTVRCSS